MSERFLRTWIVRSSTSNHHLPPEAQFDFRREGSRPVHVWYRLSGEHQWTPLGLCAEPGNDKLCFTGPWGYSEVALGEQADPEGKERHFGFWEIPKYSDGGVDPVGAWVAESQGPVGGPRQGA